MEIMAYQAAMLGEKLRRGPWHKEEDERLATFVTLMGERKWDSIAKASGLKRSGKSCRMRWLNYLRPNIKHGHISAEEEQIIIQLHEQWGNKWAKIAQKLPGRTDNEIKNYWRTHLRKKLQAQKLQAREEGDLVCKISNAKQDFLFQKDETNAWNYNGEDHKSYEEMVQITGHPLDHHELSNITYLNSPYETRLYNWMTELSSNQSSQESWDGFGLCSCYLAWNSKDNDNSILDTLGSLWDMN